MADMTIGEHKFRFGKLNAFDQLHVARRIAPLVHSAVFAAGPLNEALVAFAKGDEKASDEAMVRAFMQTAPFLQALSQLPDEDVNFVIKKALSVTMIERGGHFVPCMQGGEIMCDDLSLTDLLAVTVQCLMPVLRPILSASGLSAVVSALKGE